MSDAATTFFPDEPRFPLMRGVTALALLLLAVPAASALSYPSPPDLLPLTLHAQFVNGHGTLSREPTPDPWQLEPGLCTGTDEATFVVSSGKPVLRGDELQWTGDRGLSGPLPVGEDSVLHWVVARPTHVPVTEVTIEAMAHGMTGDLFLSAERSLSLEPGDATHAGSVGGMDIHHIDLLFEGGSRTTALARTTLLEVSVTSPGCLARHHSSPSHRPTWDLLVGTPLQAGPFEFHDGHFQAWVGSAWGLGDLVVGDLHVDTGESKRTVMPMPLASTPLCHCANDSYQYLVRWPGPAPHDSWTATAEVGSRMHPDTATLALGREADLDAEAPGPGWGVLAALVGVAWVRRR